MPRRAVGQLLCVAGVVLLLTQVVRVEPWQGGIAAGILLVVFGALVALDAKEQVEASRRPGFIVPSGKRTIDDRPDRAPLSDHRRGL
jgi:hypothetical protein